MLTWKGVPGDELTPEQVDAMWRLRAGILRIRVPEQEDREKFERRVRLGQRNLLFHDRTGTLRGMFSMYWLRSPDGQALWYLPEYGYLDPAHRGDPGFAMGTASESLSLHARHGWCPMWMAGVGYPRSFQTIDRMMPEWWTPFDEDRPPEADAILRHLHETFYAGAYDPSTRLVAMPTIPEPCPPGPRSAVWTAYEERNPGWAAGVGMSLVIRVRRRTALRVARDVVQRTARKATPRLAARR